MKYYTIGEFAKLIGKTTQTLRNWDKNDILKPYHVAESGHRNYSKAKADYFDRLSRFGFELNDKGVVRR